MNLSSLLNYGGDTDAVFSKDSRDLGKHTGPVNDRKAHVPRRHGPVNILYPNPLDISTPVRQRGYAARRPQKHVSGEFNDIAHDSAGCRHLPGSLPVVHGGSHDVSGDKYRVVDTVDHGEGMLERDQCGMDPSLDLTGVRFGYSQKFYLVAEFQAELDIERTNSRYPFRVDILKTYPSAVRQGNQNGQLMSGIDPIDIHGGICLSKSLFLCFSENILELTPFIGHPAENVV